MHDTSIEARLSHSLFAAIEVVKLILASRTEAYEQLAEERLVSQQKIIDILDDRIEQFDKWANDHERYQKLMADLQKALIDEREDHIKTLKQLNRKVQGHSGQTEQHTEKAEEPQGTSPWTRHLGWTPSRAASVKRNRA